MVIFNGVIDEQEESFDSIILYQLNKTFHSYEEKILTLLKNGKLSRAEDVLLDFCMKALQLPEKEQLFTTRLFFTSLITNIVRIQNLKGPLPSEVFAYAYKLIYEVEQWSNISTYMFHISYFVKQIKDKITLDHLFFEGNFIIEKALAIIYNELTNNKLTVNFLAKELNVSTTHISNLFKNHLKITPSEYIARKKVQAIIDELKETTESLHTIRKKFGFHNHSHFIQFFKKHTNLTPLQYIQQHIY